MTPTKKKTPEITTRVVQLSGLERGDVGVAGVGRPGPNVKVVAVSPLRFFFEEVVLYSYVNSWLGVAALDSIGQLAELDGPSSILGHLAHISLAAIAPTVIALARELFEYLQKRRASAGVT